MLDFVNNDALWRPRRSACSRARAWHKGTAEAKLGRFTKSRLALADRPDLAAEADLAEHRHVRRDGLVGQRRHNGRRDGQVGSRLADPEAARHVQIDVVGPDADAV